MLQTATVHSADVAKNRHRGNRNSNAAFERCFEQFQTSRELVWHKLRVHPFGLTAKELAAHFEVPLHSISGRVTELKAAGRAACTGERRDGCGIVVAIDPNKDLLSGVTSREQSVGDQCR